MIVTFSALAWIFIAIVSFCIAIAPLLIWRNTNRTNRLLALLLTQNGTDPNLISKTYFGSGDNIEYLGIRSSSNYQENAGNISVQDSPTSINEASKTKVCPACGTVCPASATKCRICPREF